VDAGTARVTVEFAARVPLVLADDAGGIQPRPPHCRDPYSQPAADSPPARPRGVQSVAEIVC
jgi:hypothetical protein